ncbi:ABC transporter substrate-binding protein [Georgenia yuyongxinii]|uniref:ABC transporter substrate-binding protein n=1 Tax=Georgenia yuyongxinii TaxID=2589797 RepID=A0A552WT78_9MICO|nr:ABC transporter substrate-binding protein [Georgenia yuyongxinii]TRW45886.1 ABC transporter substrate-binding protein [Georgenia yuyongxinii]
MHLLRPVGGIALAAGAALLLAACGSGASGNAAAGSTVGSGDGAEPIKIGAVLSLSGAAAAFGVPERNAAEVAVDFINDNGGIDGRPLELVVVDDKTDPTEAARAAQSLIADEGVIAIVGASTGSGTLAMAPVAAKQGVPVLAPNGTIGVTNPEEDFFPYVFRTSVSDEVTIPALLDRAKADGATDIAVFYQEDALGRFSAELLEELDADDDDFTIVASASVPLEATDVSAQATRIRDAKPDAVLMPLSSVGVGGSFLRSASDLGLEVPMYGALAVAQNAIIENAGAAATDKLIVANMIDPSHPTEDQAALYDMIREAGNEPAGGFTDLFGANSVRVIGEALKIADEISAEGLRDALESGTPLQAWALQPYTYTADSHDGLTSGGLVWTTVRDSKFVGVDK